MLGGVSAFATQKQRASQGAGNYSRWAAPAQLLEAATGAPPIGHT